MPIKPKPVRWAVVANVLDPKPSKLRRGAKVEILSVQAEIQGTAARRARRLRCCVKGLSIGGRTITTYIAARQLHKFRAARIRTRFGHDDEVGAVMAAGVLRLSATEETHTEMIREAEAKGPC